MKNLEKLRGARKQWLCVIVLALLCAGTAFAQAAPAAKEEASGEKKNAISFIDLMPLFKVILSSHSDNDMIFFCAISPRYERLIAPHVTVGGEVDMFFGKVGKDVPYLYFSMMFVGRYYPVAPSMEKFYVGAIMGFNAQSIDGKTGEEYGGFAGLVAGVEAGYRAMFGKAFFVEPSMAYIYSKPSFAPTPLGWQPSLRIGLKL